MGLYYDTKSADLQGEVDSGVMVLVKEGHEVQQQEEGARVAHTHVVTHSPIPATTHLTL